MAIEQTIQQLADQCVKCGMCLPTCPTYQVNNNENESPRGRIALMQGLISGQLQLDKKVTDHLDTCVGCLSCENICPSTVHYQTLIDSIREYTVTKKKVNSQARLLSVLLKPRIKNTLFLLLRFYQASGLQFLCRSLGLLKLLGLTEKESLIPKLSGTLKLKPHYPSTQKEVKGNIALFTGCMGNLFEQRTILASIKVLTSLGYNVDIPEHVCCGALHQHSGFTTEAKMYAKHNHQSFIQTKKYTAIIFTASGCGTQLKTSLQQSAIPVLSVMQFINNAIENNSITVQFHSLKRNIALHQPCSLKNSLKEDKAVVSLLERIPDLTFTELSSQCCGAGGKNMLTQTSLAQQIREPILAQVKQCSAEQLVSSNIGCALHLKLGLPNMPLLHPIELIAACLK